MQIAHTLAELRNARRRLGDCTLVPTMGNLHAGHLSLVDLARRSGLPVAVSIFVNRLQFAPTDDFVRYPRTLAEDRERLQAAGCDLLFAPDEQEFYPQPQRFRIQPDPELADILEGEFRPGFFVGVCTVVMKLFSCVQPRRAIFGKKDYQQLLVLRRMVEQFALPIDVEGADTCRTANGLALSSRNAFLSDRQQVQAAELARSLMSLAHGYRRRSASLHSLQREAMQALSAAGWQPDYLTIRCRSDLRLPADASGEAANGALVALGAARLGDTRLIDSFEF